MIILWNYYAGVQLYLTLSTWVPRLLHTTKQLQVLYLVTVIRTQVLFLITTLAMGLAIRAQAIDMAMIMVTIKMSVVGKYYSNRV